MRKSIVFSMDKCCICGSRENLHSHEIFFGSANRKKSIYWKLVAPLCVEHHEGTYSPHHDKNVDLWLKQEGQKAFEKYVGNRELFMNEFHKNWLDEERIERVEIKSLDLSCETLPF